MASPSWSALVQLIILVQLHSLCKYTTVDVNIGWIVTQFPVPLDICAQSVECDSNISTSVMYYCDSNGQVMENHYSSSNCAADTFNYSYPSNRWSSWQYNCDASHTDCGLVNLSYPQFGINDGCEVTQTIVAEFCYLYTHFINCEESNDLDTRLESCPRIQGWNYDSYNLSGTVEGCYILNPYSYPLLTYPLDVTYHTSATTYLEPIYGPFERNQTVIIESYPEEIAQQSLATEYIVLGCGGGLVIFMIMLAVAYCAWKRQKQKNIPPGQAREVMKLDNVVHTESHLTQDNGHSPLNIEEIQMGVVPVAEYLDIDNMFDIVNESVNNNMRQINDQYRAV